MTSSRVRIGLLFAVLSAAALPPAALSWGLRTRFAEVSVSNLKIGKTYSLAETVNFPLRVANLEAFPVELSVRPHAPTEEELKPGYERIPDISWIALQRTSFTVPGNMEAVTDVIISIPNDESLLGRRFCAYLHTQTENKSAMGVGLKSRLLLEISSQKPTDEELKAKFVQKRLANLNFHLSPMEATVPDVTPGQSAKVTDSGQNIVLVNPNSEKYTFRVQPVPIWETSISLPPGFTGVTDPKWLKIKNPIIKMKPYSMQPLELSVEIPPGDERKDKRYMLLLRAEIMEQDIPAYAFMKVFVNTKK
jgi:hypothetical protein